MRHIVRVFVLTLCVLAISGCTKNDTQKAADQLTGVAAINSQARAEKELAVAAAKELWRNARAQDTDLSAGPCLSDKVIPGWVADIAHNPRQAIDDEPENQCAAFRNGIAKHFVELDLQGNLIRAE